MKFDFWKKENVLHSRHKKKVADADFHVNAKPPTSERGGGKRVKLCQAFAREAMA